MFQRVLISNRGEIASRIIRTCKKMGLESVAIYSDADRRAPYVFEADSAYYLGGNEAAMSYLNQERILELAQRHDVDAIHPGYGFLSENAEFVNKCKLAGITFIGPGARVIDAMGSKASAKILLEGYGVPLIPGYHGEDQSEEKLTLEANITGFPLLIKAAAGGGGKGMRIVRRKDDLKQAIKGAKREALKAFGDDRVIIEKYVEKARHIEVQIFGDQHGNVIHMFERECTIQRRYQKIIEESPSPALSDVETQRICETAVQIGQILEYDNAGTVEFIFDDLSRSFYFLEVNTRLQVEHPVTEAITGCDLVQMQIESAAGAPLTLKQEDVKRRGYALECRLYAEDPSNNFLPDPGKIWHWKLPAVSDFRCDSAVQSLSEISVYYDPMIAKLIAWGETRMATFQKMAYVLRHLVCLGIQTNQQFLLSLITNEKILRGAYHTELLSDDESILQAATTESHHLHMGLIVAVLVDWKNGEDRRSLLRHVPSGWRNNFYQAQKRRYVIRKEYVDISYTYISGRFRFNIDDIEYEVNPIRWRSDQLSLEIDESMVHFDLVDTSESIWVHNSIFGNISIQRCSRFETRSNIDDEQVYRAQMPSQVVDVKVSAGDKVLKGQPLVILSSMKMENTIFALSSGTVSLVNVGVGDNIENGTLLIEMESDHRKDDN